MNRPASRTTICPAAVGLLLSFLFYFCASAFAAAQDFPSQLLVRGRVSDAAGAAVAGSVVSLDADSDPRHLSVRTDQNGVFELKVEAGKKHLLRVEFPGFKPRVVELPAASADTDLPTVVLEAGSGIFIQNMEFSDAPNFTVAGVTDWSNVGLHGSDVNVKTSEALTKDAVALKSSVGSGSGDTEANAHRRLGDEKERSGDPVAAEREYETSAKLDPSEQNYFAWGAELLLHRAGVPAVEILTKGAALHPSSQRMIAALGAALYANGQYIEAAQQMCRAADLLPRNAEPYLFLGRIEQAASDSFPCSEEKLRSFASEQPRNASANFYYGLVLMKKAKRSQQEDDFARAEECFRKAEAANPNYGDVYVQLGMMYNARGKKRQALREFENAVRVGPDLTAAHYQLSLAYRRSGEIAKADAEMKKYEELRRSEQAALEKDRKVMKQFVTILQQSSPKP